MTTFGSVTQRRDGRWRARYSDDGERKTIPGSFETREEAEAVLEALRRTREATTRTHTMSSLADEWLDRRELEGKRGIKRERGLWRAIVADGHADEILHTPLRRLRRAQIQRYADDLKLVPGRTGARLARQSIKNRVNLFRLFLKWAVRRGHVDANVATDVEVDQSDASTKEVWTYAEPDEIRALTNDPRIPLQFRTMYRVAVYVGLRKGELLGLHWEDVVLTGDEPHLVVRYSYRQPTKSGKVARVPLLPPVVDGLREWRDRDGVTRTRGLVFLNPDRGVYGESYRCGWDVWPAKVGITRPIRFHDLRHTCAAHLVSGTWGRALPLEQVRAWLRHSTINVTMRYAHLRPEALRGAAADLAKHWTDDALDQGTEGTTGRTTGRVLNIRPTTDPVTE